MDFINLFSFLDKLSHNNNRDWFNENKGRYEILKKDFDQFIDKLIPMIRQIDPTVGQISARDCVFRIYRDVRFSANKDPYKIHFGAYIASGGRKSKMAGYYIHLQPNQSFVAAGAYMPEPEILKEIRYEIMDQLSEFKKIIEDKQFIQYFARIDGEKLKTAPKGFPKDFKELELIKHKSYEIIHKLDQARLNEKDTQNYLLDIVSAAIPYNRFMNKVIQHTLESE
jgi:uncharacterized protein (TIGR02453 family)